MSISQRPLSPRLTCKRFRCSQEQKIWAAEWRLFTFPFPYPLKYNFPLYDLHCVTTLRKQHNVDCNTCVVPLFKASINLLHHKPNNTHSQLNRWIRCHSAERCQTFYNEGWWQFADWQAVSSDVINTTSDKITTVKWSFDVSSTANEVRAFGNVYPCTFSSLIWVETY